MSTRLIITPIAILLAFGGCRKREYAPEQIYVAEEVFRMDAQVDGQVVELRAGANGYYCYSGVEQGPDGLYQYFGELKKFGCDACPESFFVGFFDPTLRAAGTPPAIDSTLSPGKKQYAPGLQKGTTLQFSGHLNKNAVGWKWDFGDGGSSDASSLQHTYYAPGRYDVCLEATSETGCNDMTCNTITILENGGVFAVSIEVSFLADRKVRFTAKTIGGTPDSYTWSFGDGTGSDAAQSEHEYPFEGSYPVTLVVHDAEGHVAGSKTTFVTRNDHSSCAALAVLTPVNKVASNLGKVSIRWTDAANEEFSSDMVVQPEESYFEILGVNDFDRNEQGQLTKQVTARINARLSNGKKDIWLKSDQAVIAVAYD